MYAKQEVTCLDTFGTGDKNVMGVEYNYAFLDEKNFFRRQKKHFRFNDTCNVMF